MGCDIHLVREIVSDARWIAVDTFQSHEDAHKGGWSFPVARSRNYQLFAALAGVRGEGPAARGLPDDASDTTRYLADVHWGSDGHSHSWLPLKDAAALFLEHAFIREDRREYATKWPASYFFGVEDEDIDKNRIVFWFDN